MKNTRSLILKWIAATAAVPLIVATAQAQTEVLINAFDSPDELAIWGNWFGTAYYQILFDSSDGSNNPASGSMQIQSFYPDSGIGGCCGPQFVAYNGNDGISPPLAGNGGNPVLPLATNIEFDVRFDPASVYITNNNNWPTIEVGTRGVDFGQHNFGTFTLPHSETNWVHMVLPIAANASWTNIPNVYFKHYDTALNGPLNLYVDNIIFTTAAVPIVPPTMSIQKPTTGLRVFAGSTANTYDREHLTAIDTNQSWVGGSYPVSYSFRLLNFPTPPTDQTAVFRYHIFLIPLNYAGGNSTINNEYLEYQAGHNLWLNISALDSLTNGQVQAEIAWKTNLPDANPNQIALTITNSTAVGTWTLRFDTANTGVLIPPGASAVAFSLPADAAAQFANPLLAQFGVQPDSGWGIGQWTDVAWIRTTNVASPGVNIFTDFTTATSIDTNIWDVSNSAQPSSLALVPGTSAWWVYWGYPDYNWPLATTADLAAIPWKTPVYYTGDVSNTLFRAKMGANVWALVPQAALPTVDGVSNSAPATKAFYRLQETAPAE